MWLASYELYKELTIADTNYLNTTTSCYLTWMLPRHWYKLHAQQDLYRVRQVFTSVCHDSIYNVPNLQAESPHSKNGFSY